MAIAELTSRWVTGNCATTIEVAGPKLPRFIRAVPSDLVVQAIKIIQECATSSEFITAHIGGFITYPFHRLERYVTDLTVNLDDGYRRTSSSFFFSF